MLAGLALGFLVWCALIAAQIGAPTASSRWDARALDEKARLAAARDGPRLLVLGGSSAHYGFNCAIIEARVGMPCVNLAVHAGLRLRYELDYVRRVARRGDILLLAFEYQVYDEAGAFDPVMIDYVMARDPRYLATLSLPALARFSLSVDEPRLIEGLAARVARPLGIDTRDTTPQFDRDGDELHNQVAARSAIMLAKLRQEGPVHSLVQRNAPTPYAVNLLTAIAEWCRTHGVELWATYPATVRYAVYDSAATRSTLARIAALYASLGVPMLERPEDLFWPADDFFNSAYHPTAEATAARSRVLAEQVRTRLSARRPGPPA